MAHGANDSAGGEGGIPRDHDLADLHLGTLVDVKNEFHRVGARNPLIGGLHHGELAAVLGQQLLQDDFGFLDFRGIELAFDR